MVFSGFFFCSSHFIGFLELANLRRVGLVFPVLCLVLKKKKKLGCCFFFCFFLFPFDTLSSPPGKGSTKRKKELGNWGQRGGGHLGQ